MRTPGMALCPFIPGQKPFIITGERIFGAIPERHMFAALDDSTLHVVPQETGDGDSNHILTRDADYQYCYAHANAPFAPDLFHTGRILKQGEDIKLTGNTWNGRPVRDPHFHISMETYPEADKLNTFSHC